MKNFRIIFKILPSMIFLTAWTALSWAGPGGGQLSGELSPGYGVAVGMKQSAFGKIYPRANARTYRSLGEEQWITFNEPRKGKSQSIITFHFSKEKLQDWSFNNRKEVVEEYLGEFCSQGIVQGDPKMYAAVKNVLEKIPQEVFLAVTDRTRPVLFTEFYDAGTARFASSSEILSTPDDVPSFQNGLTIIKLGTALNTADSPDAIAGVVAHELAHRYLEHFKRPKKNCALEKEANQTIQKWGFKEEFSQAKKFFGHHEGESQSCQE